MGNIIFGMISPHPPVLVPQIGGTRLKEIERTKKALESASKKLKSLDPDTVVIITPHGEISQNTLHLYASHVFEGDFSAFGQPKVKLSFKGDTELAHRINKEAASTSVLTAEIQESFLDHGVMVPLYYAQAAGFSKSILPIAISLRPLRELYEFGRIIKKAVATSGKKVAVIASADMSHKLTKDAPAGYDPKGKVFDERLVELVRNSDVDGILDFEAILADQAGQDSLWSVSILLGCLDGGTYKSEVLSYEGPFGVGYMVAKYEVA